MEFQAVKADLFVLGKWPLYETRHLTALIQMDLNWENIRSEYLTRNTINEIQFNTGLPIIYETGVYI